MVLPDRSSAKTRQNHEYNNAFKEM
jgi:hypothetical protein